VRGGAEAAHVEHGGDGRVTGVLATCLGCGLACDDIVVTVRDGRIAEAVNACDLGVRWFGQGQVPTLALVRGNGVTVPTALAEAALILKNAKHPLVYLTPELSTNAQRAACALADVLGARLDTVTPNALMLAVQERGRCGATFGELRHRADMVVFWGLDPDHAYPRLRSRYLPDRDGLQFISVDLSAESAALTRAAVLGHATTPLAERLVKGKYVAIIVDGEQRPEYIEPLLALTEALNGPTRAALIILRGGGNRIGAESVLTWQTGYPRAIDFSRGAPRYCPYDAFDSDVVLVVGSGANLANPTQKIVIGPRASEGSAIVAIDTGVAGIHEGGTAVRTDDIPVPLRPPLSGAAPDTVAILRELTQAVRQS
jgi:formylmethanofuran dehydrogenase subunit B